LVRIAVVFSLISVALYPAAAQMSNPSAASTAARPADSIVEQVRAYRLANEIPHPPQRALDDNIGRARSHSI